MLTRYSGALNYILNMDYEEAVELIEKAKETFENEKLFQRWINGYQNISFVEFKNELNPPNIIMDNKKFKEPKDVAIWIFNYFDEKEVE